MSRLLFRALGLISVGTLSPLKTGLRGKCPRCGEGQAAALIGMTTTFDQLAIEPGSTVAQLRDELLGITERREELESLSDSVSSAVSAQDWSTLVAQLESDALAELEEQRQSLAANLATAEASSSAAINLREELAAIEAELAEQANQELVDLRTQVAELDEEAGGLRQQIRSDVLSSGRAPGSISICVGRGTAKALCPVSLARAAR